MESFGKLKSSKDGREGKCRECRKKQRPKQSKKCLACGDMFESNQKNALFCNRKCAGKYKSHDYNYVYNYFRENGCTLLDENYKDANKPLLYLCSCGNTSKISFSHFKQGKKCRRCMGERIAEKARKYSIDDIRLEFERVGLILLESDYINNVTPMKYICECGRESRISYAHFLEGKRCKQCGFKKTADKQRYDFTYVTLVCNNRGFKLLDGKYFGANRPMEVECLKCRKTSAKTFSWIKRGSKCIHCHIQENRGENHASWNPELTADERITRRVYDEYREWRSDVFERDKYTCQCCGVKGGKIVAHHLDGYNWCVEKRTDIDNGITLCEKCHSAKYSGSFHAIYGNGNNTREQFENWIQGKRKQDAI